MKQKDLEKITKFIEKQSSCVLCSVDADGFPQARAMLKPRQRLGLKSFYFSTNTSSEKVKQLRENNKACLYFYHKGWFKYVGVMLKGTIEVSIDQEVKNLVWRAGDTRFYKKGVTDDDYCVLKFTAESGRSYCNLSLDSFEIK